MLIHYLKTSFRSIQRYSTYFATNILSLVVGIAVFTALSLYVVSQSSYNAFHHNYRRIARLTTQINSADNPTHFAVAAKPIAPLLAKQFPEIENYVRLAELESSVHTDSSIFEAQQVLFADSSFLSIFSFPLQRNPVGNIMNNPAAALISPQAAQKYFGGKNPVGKNFTILTPKDTFQLTIAGIIEQAPTHSTIAFELVANFSLIEKNYGNNPGALASFSTYLLCRDKEAIHTLNHKLEAYKTSYLPTELAKSMTHYAQPFDQVYFSTDLHFDFGKKGNRTHVYTVAALSITILIMAILNYLNMAAALLLKRNKELSIRSILGAGSKGIFGQIFIESFALTGIAIILALLLVFALGKWNEDFFLLTTTVNFKYVGWLILGMLLFIPLSVCFFLFSHNVSNSSMSMSKRIKPLKKGYVLRKGVVLVQLAFSIVFIIASLIISRQMNYVSQKELGYVKENILLIHLPRNWMPQRANAFKNELLTIAQVKGVSNSSFGIYGMMGQKHVTFQHKGESKGVIMNYNAIDDHFLSTFKLKLLAGRSFDARLGSEALQSLLINESAMKLLGYSDVEEALQSSLRLNEEAPRKIVGVIANYHYASLHEKIEPLILVTDPLETLRQVALHVGTGNINFIEPELKEIWHSFQPNLPFQYTYLEDMIASDYSSEQGLSAFFGYAAFILVLLSCIGLVSVTTFTLEQKEKEIGIRKVLGASVNRLVMSINGEFLPLIFLANLLAWPLAYFAAKQWLQAFTYRIQLEWYYFTLAGIIGLLLSVVVISYLAAKACLKNPVSVLRGE